MTKIKLLKLKKGLTKSKRRTKCSKRLELKAGCNNRLSKVSKIAKKRKSWAKSKQ